MNRIIKLGAAMAALVGITLAGTGAGHATAPPTRGPQHTSTGPSVDRDVIAWSARISPYTSVGIPTLYCPADAPYLIKNVYSPGRIVPWGVEVLESSENVGVTIPYAYKDIFGYARGTKGLLASATNWGIFEFDVDVKLHCTSDPSHGYQP